jgi:hypothetical protein
MEIEYCVRHYELYDDCLSSSLLDTSTSLQGAVKLAQTIPAANIITKEQHTGGPRDVLTDYDLQGNEIEICSYLESLQC